MPRKTLVVCLTGACLLGSSADADARPDSGYHPWVKDNPGKAPSLDLSYEGREQRARIKARQAEIERNDTGRLPDGWVQVGDQVWPEELTKGSVTIDPQPVPGFEDRPGNKYPRKHTVFLNFGGADMVGGGSDISALNKSPIAKTGPYPPFSGGASTANATAQAFQNDVARWGMVVTAERPDPVVPYTMVMIGGSWQNTNIDSSACGVAPAGDCGAAHQRHVVYTFECGGATSLANTSSQEAGHAWGLDHTTNCSSVMSYCGGGDKGFSANCDQLCGTGCGGQQSSCDYYHETYCGEGSNRQNEQTHLDFAFGDTTPDNEPPYVEILAPADGAEYGTGASVQFKAEVDDNFGGVGYKITITHDAETVLDDVDYEQDYIDGDDDVGINLVNLEDGTYTIVVHARDHYDHTAEDTVTFTVVPGGMSGSGGSAGGTDSGGTATGGTATSGTATGGTDGTDGTGGQDTGIETFTGGGTGGGGEDKGCACSAVRGGTGSSAPLFALGLVFAAGRRRRSAPAA